APGIDAAAHDGALSAGRTIAVLDSARADIALGPDIMCKGVVPASMELDLVSEIRNAALGVLDSCLTRDTDSEVLKNRMRETLGSMLKARLGKKPMVVPIVMEL
ncbi:MAG TPA: hypothetical protein PLW83_08865, partial [Deltaproteobacteria bacterium]|nr:hypothetical protein [Deltaproteobacteria bacterium]